MFNRQVVILSGVVASLREAATESNDPYCRISSRRLVCFVNPPEKSPVNRLFNLQGSFDFADRFARESVRCAQDDTVGFSSDVLYP